MCNNKINYISPSLLNSWLYMVNTENADSQDFIDYLHRVEKPTTEAQQKGLDFENEVYAGNKPLYNPYVQGGLYQVKVSKMYKDIMLLGIIDVLQPTCIYDVKTTKNYIVGKYGKTSQHLIYPYCTGIKNFAYLINKECYVESYTYKDGQAEQLIDDFIRYLHKTDLYAIWQENWYKTEKEITEYGTF